MSSYDKPWITDSKPKILAVDDREENLLAIQAALDGCGYEITESLSGLDAIERVRENEFAVILLDVQMPGLNGFETAKLIRQQENGHAAPIIFLTAIHRTAEYEELGYEAGAVDYIFKPINVSILKAKIAVFAELQKKSQQLQKSAELLKRAALREQEVKLLSEALKARDEFLSIAAHELKTPITPLNLQTQMFIEMFENGTLATAPREPIAKLLYTSQSQVSRLSRLINELLDLGRISGGRLELNREAVNLGEMVRSTLNSFAHQTRSAGCELRLEIQENVTGYWDGFRLEQVVINLYSNALKYGAGKPVDVRVSSDEHNAYIVVQDHGIGIAAKDQARIFERFERAVSSKNYGGLGLGLFIASHIVSMHSGTIAVESQPERGAKFTVQLPLNRN